MKREYRRTNNTSKVESCTAITMGTTLLDYDSSSPESLELPMEWARGVYSGRGIE